MELSEVYSLFVQGMVIGGLLSTLPFVLGYAIDFLSGLFNK